MSAEIPSPPRIVGRYAVYGEIASGGMATVRYGRLLGPVGFSRTVAVKCLHPHFAKDPDFVAMFVDEARVAARVRHPNVVPTLDVVATDDELVLVMEYVQGESLANLVRASREAGSAVPLDVVSAIGCAILNGLHAAHEATSERGEPLEIVHRDVSPQNVLVGADGVARVLDFGVAKATGRLQTTREGQLKGKIAYMAPEQLHRGPVDRRTDVYAAGVVLWELLTGSRLFSAESEGSVVTSVLEGVSVPPSARRRDVSKAIDDVVMRALESDPARRFGTALEMADALESIAPMASPRRVAEWLKGFAGEALARRAGQVALLESDSHSGLYEQVGAQRSPEPATEPVASAGPSEARAQVSTGPIATIGTRPRSRRRVVVSAIAALPLAVAVAMAWHGRSPAIAPASVPGPVPVVSPSSEALPAAPPGGAPVPGPTVASTSAKTGDAPPSSPQLGPSSTRRSSPSGKKAPCAIRRYVDDSGITHFARDCK